LAVDRKVSLLHVHFAAVDHLVCLIVELELIRAYDDRLVARREREIAEKAGLGLLLVGGRRRRLRRRLGTRAGARENERHGGDEQRAREPLAPGHRTPHGTTTAATRAACGTAAAGCWILPSGPSPFSP